MTFNFSLFIITVSVVAAISASIFSHSDPDRYFALSATASSGEECLETSEDFNTDTGKCSSGGGGGGGGSDVGCDNGEIYIDGQGCTPEFETTPECDPDSYYVKGQGCTPIFETPVTCDPDSYYVPGQGCTPIIGPEEKTQSGGAGNWPPTCPEEGCENPCPNGGSWDPLTQNCYTQEVDCDVPIDPKIAVACGTACALLPGSAAYRPGCTYLCAEGLTPCDVGPAERVEPIQQQEP